MWPVARKWAMMEEQEKDSLEFHDMDEFKNSDEEVASEEGDDDNDAENGCAHKNYHFSPSLIKQRGLNSLHQIARDGHVEELSTYISALEENEPREPKPKPGKKTRGLKLEEENGLKSAEPVLSILSSIDDLDHKKNSPLHYAVRYSHIDIVKALIDMNANVNMVGSDGMTPVHYAARYGKNLTSKTKTDEYDSIEDLGLNVLKMLISAGGDFNAKDEYSLTPLHHASMRGNITIVEHLVKEPGININARDKMGSTPLHIAATYKCKDTVRILLENNADHKLKDKQRQSPLHRASQEGSDYAIGVLLEVLEDKEAVMLEEDGEGNTPLTLAVESGNSAAVEVFMSSVEDPSLFINTRNKQGECPIHYAARSGDKATMEMLLDNGAEIDCKNASNQTPLYLAAASESETNQKADRPLLSSLTTPETKENIEVVQMLIDRDADLDLWDVDGITPLMIAAEKGHKNVVDMLVRNQAKLDKQDKDDHNVFHICAAYGRPEIVKSVIETNPEALPLLQQNDQYDNTPLHLAAKAGQTEFVRELLDEKYEVEYDNKNEDESTPCHLAAKRGHVDVLKLILEKDPFAIFDKDEDDNTPLHLAAKERHSEAVEFLLSQGASVHKRNAKKWTALDCAAASGSYNCAILLLNYDSPVDPKDIKGVTPLHLSAMHGHEKVAQLLLDHDACLDLENDMYMNALELAIFYKHRSVVEVILDNPKWKVAMKTASVSSTIHGERIPNTPMRMLIRVFPDLAEKVFDKCIKNSSSKIDMDFQFLEDTFSLNHIVKSSGQHQFKYEDLKDDNLTPYDATGTLSMINHPLMIMVQEKQKQLLKHPLCLALLRRKWKFIGRVVFYTQLLVYILFMSFLTAFILLKLNNKTFPDEIDHYRFYAECEFSNDPTEHVLRILVLLTTAFNIIIEISQMIRMKKRYIITSNFPYISISNVVDWGIYILTIIFVFNPCIDYETDGCKGQRCWQWPVGSFLITASWLNLLTYFQHVPFFGIYILMFIDIFKTASQFALILFIFIVAFGLGFHILFINHSAFDSSGDSLLKTYVMMIGEFEFEGLFTEHDESNNDTLTFEEAKNIPFYYYSAILFVFFVFVMSIIITNLLVGLAVDDIKEIQENAELEKLSMHVQLVLESERFLPHLKCCLSNNFLLRYMQPEETIFKYHNNCWKILKDITSKEKIVENFRERARGDTNDNDLDKMREKQSEIENKLNFLEMHLHNLSEDNKRILSILQNQQ